MVTEQDLQHIYWNHHILGRTLAIQIAAQVVRYQCLRREHIADFQCIDEQRLKQAENVADQVMMIRRRNRSYQPTQEQLNAVYDAGMVWVDYSLGRYGLMSRVEYRNYSSVALAKTELLRRKSVVEQTEATRRGISKRQCCVVM
ncbi:hypothetical protein Tdes44962_MAKER07641 [Teratosphaeria destructans]|uniref:Uncharacterized protein n=1 Tax=Teratosphaeria destructans TaxID=418781 RepID=A0A9W7SYG3_9PEZI|nr:hypothetical protein Tdes44962_MAKER07641 [Teratosphaeria destructans]